MLCFKYAGLSHLHFGMLARGELFFASPDELNDGSECRPRYVLRGSLELWERLSHFILFEAWLQTQEGRPPDPEGAHQLLDLAAPLAAALRRRVGRRDMDFDELWPSVLEDLPPLLKKAEAGLAPRAMMKLVQQVIRGRLTDALREELYMASFSLDPGDPTMWGHYAAAERGFCLVIRAPEDQLSITSPIRVFPGSRPSTEHSGMWEMGSYDDAHVELKPVIYRRSPPRVNAFQNLLSHFHYSEEEEHYDVPLLLPGDAPDREESKLGLVKATTWRYEKEVRAFLPAWRALPPEVRCVRLDPSHFAGLIFGPKMSRANRRRAVIAAYPLRGGRPTGSDDAPPFVFLEAVQNVDRFELDIRVAGVLGEFYGDGSLPFRPIDRLENEEADQVGSFAEELNGGLT